MPPRGARLLFRIAGWLLTPLVLVVAAALGATIGLVIAARVSPNAGLALTVASSLICTILGLVFWVKLLRRSPELRETFAVTEEGLPQSELVEQLVHPDAPKADRP